MSRIDRKLYFSPEITFDSLDVVSGHRLPEQFRQRIAGYYLNPARFLAGKYDAFAAGVLVVCAIDALAAIMTSSTSVTGRITSFCRNIPELAVGNNAEIFCQSFRNGLVHSARVKDGNEFSYDIDRIAVRNRNHLAVHPGLLAEQVLNMLDLFVAELKRDPTKKKAFVRKIKSKFHYELSQY